MSQKQVADVLKDPAASLEYSLNWAAWLVGGDTIASATWSIEGAVVGDVTPLAVDASSFVGAVCTVRLTGGTSGYPYWARCTVVTDDGNEDVRSIKVSVTNR